jgi:hypothetical protein
MLSSRALDAFSDVIEGEPREVPQDPQPVLLALLRVELDPPDVVAPTIEAKGVVPQRRAPSRLGVELSVAVHVVEVRGSGPATPARSGSRNARRR